MKSMFRSKVHKKSRTGLRKPERIIFGRDDVRIHRRFYSFLESRFESQLLFSASENIEHVLLVVDDPEPVSRASSVKELMAGLYTCPKSERTFKNSLGGLVFAVPRLVFVTKEEPDASDVHLPGRVQSGVVDVG